MNEEINQISQQEQFNKIKDDARYKQIQQELKLKQKKKQQINQVNFKDQVEIKSLFNWTKSKDGEFQIHSSKKNYTNIQEQDIKYSADKILRLLGYEINITEKTDSLKQEYMRLYIEAKSPNLLLAKFSQVKLGMHMALLSVLGISFKELQELQKKALGETIEENKILFAQNEYNDEMMLLFSNNSNKKEKAKKMVFKELRNQLIAKMNALGQKDYYTSTKITEIKKEQVQNIISDLFKEKENLQYIFEFQ
jgi:hypothetical protein